MVQTARYVWQRSGWPVFRWDGNALLGPLGRARQAQGKLLGLAEDTGVELQGELLVEEAFSTSAIEGERLDRASIRSSVARRLGLPNAGLPPADRQVEGLVEMLLDATSRHSEPLSAKRLQGWHAALFPTGYSGIHPIRIGGWRTGSEPMRVISGPVGKEKVHYEAPPAERLECELERFLSWWQASSPAAMDGLLRAGMAHFWFVSIHPFEDGNGRVARALTDMALAQDELSGTRLYSMSAQISAERNDYYQILERAQQGDGDLTGWLEWFLGCLSRAMQRAWQEIGKTVERGRFWQRHAETELNDRQRKVINRLLCAGPGGFEGGLTNRKYVGLTRVSRETAKRDLADLIEKGILIRTRAGGRSASYELAWGSGAKRPA